MAEIEKIRLLASAKTGARVSKDISGIGSESLLVEIEMNKNLPIWKSRCEIVEAVKNNSVVVITAETGAGKSTQVPQYLLNEGYELVVTQPRRLAARTVAQRVAEERGENLGGIVGYRTAVDRQDSPATSCLFCTDGLALVRELMGQNKGVLVLDEVHEWNENMEVLVAWAKRQIQEGVDFKVVIMSATMESEKLGAFFDDAPVISVPGRLFPVENRQPSSKLVDDIANLVSEGCNVLVFQPGKAEIDEIISAFGQRQVSAEVLPLHGQLTPQEQAKCFKHYGRPKVVISTNVAQTSVTIDDIDAVVDSGMERRIELVDGVEGLYLKPISSADSKQRKGRAGRTKDGIYIDHCGVSTRPDFPVAEIMRKRLDQTVLRLAIAGFDMEELDFFHQPSKADITDARKTLVALGCMTEKNEVTKIGKLVNRLPVSVQYARMLVEADRLGVVDDVLTVAAILEQGGITVPPPSRNRPERPDWRRMVPFETESDVMGQLAVWEMAKTMTKDEMYENGLAIRSYFRAKEIRKHLSNALERFLSLGSATGSREDILKSVCAGMVNHLYQGSYYGYKNGDDVSRELGTASLVRGGEWLVALPFDLQIKTRRGMMTLNLIQLASKVDPMWLAEVAPQLVRIEEGLNPTFDPEQDSCVSTAKTYFNNQMVKEEVMKTPDHEAAEKVFIQAFATKRIDGSEVIVDKNAVIRRDYEQLWIRSGGQSTAFPTQQDERELYERELLGKGIISVKTFEQAVHSGSVNVKALFFTPVSKEERKKVDVGNPEMIEIDDQVLVVNYSKDSWSEDFCVKAEVENALVYGTEAESITLPSGRQVQLISDGKSAMTFPELREKLEKARIERCWVEARREHETSWINDPQKVIDWLDRVGESVEITRTENGNGVYIYGFVGLKQYASHAQWQLFLADAEEKATEETQKSLEVLFKTAVREQSSVPQEEPWQVKNSSWYASWSLTDLGTALNSRYEQLVCEHAKGLTSNNIKEKNEALNVAMEHAKLEIGGEHESVKKVVEETKASLEGKIQSIEEKNFVNSEIEEARGYIKEAEEYLVNGSYVDAKAKCEKVNEVWKQAQKRIAQRQIRVDAGEILVNFEAWHRRGGMNNCGDGWVVLSDGSFRERDSDTVLRFKSNGTYIWNYVNEDELALKWSCGTMRDVVGSSEFVVVKMPVGGLTEAQREAVRQIELEDIGTVENSFGLDPEAIERQEKLIDEVADAFPVCPVCKEALIIDMSAYRELIGEFGIHICSDNHKISGLVNWNKPFDQETEGRDAQVIVSKRISSGMIEALAYEKWGGWNINLRWRELTEEELAIGIEQVEVADHSAPSANSMADLLAKFGK